MRWRFAENDGPDEKAGRGETLKAIDRWWKLFSENAQALDDHFDRRGKTDVVKIMDALDGVHDGFGWEFGSGVTKEGHRLVITPESEPALRPLLNVMLGRAPNLPRWEFFSYRLPETREEFRGLIDGRTSVKCDGVTVTAEVGHHNRIDLKFHLPPAGWPGEAEAPKFAFFSTERLLGEMLLDQWVGAIDAAVGINIEGAVPLENLAERVHDLTGSVVSALPASPRFHQNFEDVQWSMLELRPVRDLPEYAGWSDLLVAVSPEPALFHAAHSRSFYSTRFSRFGETFCYLKIDGRDGLDPDFFSNRGSIEDTLSVALKAYGLGCTVGGGTGLIYLYIELALVDVEKSIPVIRNVLRRGKINRRSWLRFHDADLADEWVGIWDETPAPPTK